VAASSAPFVIDPMKEGDIREVAAMEGPTRMDEAQVRAELERPWARIWVARETEPGSAGKRASPARDEIIGYLVAWHVADELHVMNVATRADRRRRGIGRALVDAAVAYARARRVRHALLEVRRSNRPAISLYRSVGFFAMGVRTRYYADDEDAVEMVLLFDPTTGDIVAHADEIRLEA
jgi:ribosomal-protein-alanine N-acetyltransferase